MPRNYWDVCMLDKLEIKNKNKINMQYDAKITRGITPKYSNISCNIGEWKVVYSTLSAISLKHWIIRIFCNESALYENKLKVRFTFIIYDKNDKIIEVHEHPTFLFRQHSYFDVPMEFKTDEAKKLHIILRQVLF